MPYIHFPLWGDNINNPYQIIVYDNSGNLISTKKCVDQINGYEYQFYECYDAITNKKIETKSKGSVNYL